jgi:hypothetical protein
VAVRAIDAFQPGEEKRDKLIFAVRAFEIVAVDFSSPLLA